MKKPKSLTSYFAKSSRRTVLSKDRLNMAGFLLISLFWGGSFLAIRFSIDSFPPFAAATLRVGIATVLMWFFMRARNTRASKDTSPVLQLLGIGFFTLGFPWALLFWGEQHVSPAMCSILNSTTPLFTVLVTTAIFRKERIGWGKGAGVAIGFLGVLCIFAPAILDGGKNSSAGMIAVTLMAVCYAIGIAWLKNISHRTNASTAFFLQGVGALTFLIPLTVLTETDALMVSRWSSLEGWISIFYLGVFSTALAQLIFFRLVRDWGSIKASAVTYAIPVVAILLDWIVFGTFLKLTAIIGAAIVLLGVHIIHRSPTYEPGRISETEPA